MRRGRRPRGQPPRFAVVCLAVLGLLALPGCSAAPSAAGGDPRSSARATPATTQLTVAPGGAAAGTAGLDTDRTTASSATTCLEAVGAQLRERTTVGRNGLVTILGGALPCRSVGIWAARFLLESDPALDSPPQFGAAYTGARQLAVRLPVTSARCTAAAVFFAVDADDQQDAIAAARTAVQVRADLASWPAGATALVPGGGILRGRSSAVLAATVVGDPAACSPGESVSSPFAAVGDCWTSLPDAPGSASTSATASAAAGDSTRFRRTTCTEQHTHEVYWAEALTTQQFLAEGQPAGLGAAAWARKRAGEVCVTRSTALTLDDDVKRADVFLEYLWPATLAYPPSGSAGWSKAQVVCLARWTDGRTSTRRILNR